MPRKATKRPPTEAESIESRSAERATRCPACDRSFTSSTSRPFCSDRCKLIDLGRWLGEEYAVAGEPAIIVDDGEA